MRVLLDTNILIHREASTVVNDDIGVLFRWLDRLKYTKCAHPLSIDEIKKHKDPKTQKTFLTKLDSYETLKTTAPVLPEIQSIIDTVDKSENDFIDSKLLNELANKRVDLLITEDANIHAKAKKLGLAQHVYTINSLIQKAVDENPEMVDYKVLSVKKEHFGNVNISDPFFQSFIEDYKGYKEWFNRKADEVCYICKEKNKIVAFLYLKIENQEDYTDINPIFKKGKRLKIGALKVIQYGTYLGERLLKIAFDNALINSVSEIYVTIFPKRPEHIWLIRFLQDWGFIRYGNKATASGVEDVFVRKLDRIAYLDKPKFSYPFISKAGNFFIVPIHEKYHTELFPDSILKTELPGDYVDGEPHRNALSKAYLSYSIERGLNSGDVIIFYRTGGYYKGVVTTLGVVESIMDSFNNVQDLKKASRKRCALDDKDIEDYWNRYPSLKPFLVNFLYVYSFPKRPNMKDLIEMGIIKDITSAPRGFTKISLTDFVKILKASSSNESIIVD